MIIEQAPNSKTSLKAAQEWVGTPLHRSQDAQGLYEQLVPELRQAVAYGFSDANPNNWAELSPGWLDEKRERGWPETIGVATGALKRAATVNAQIAVTKTHLTWGINENESSPGHGIDGWTVGDYARDFHAVRPIFKSTMAFLRSVYKKAAQKWLTEQMSNV
ncbi:MAG: hypothetical protein CVV44_20350 [Spirochaetae bacterium HGW-Spirochaetae-1]|jgi:hypothetical protein|nr:MAG: hypothetical protein CVV44_20350 [Spirochaetae bacterium HGW-Spirochaetae-1]